MKKEIIQEIEIPEGVEAEINEKELVVKGSEGENKRNFKIHNLIFEKKGNKIILGHKKATKKEKKIINTNAAHIRNMIEGVQKKFEYKLKMCFNHFPFTVEEKGNKIIIKNFLGEKVPREFEVKEKADIQIKGQDITVTSCNKEIAGQVAATLEKMTKISNRDRRIFQDGIFITEKNGRTI